MPRSFLPILMMVVSGCADDGTSATTSAEGVSSTGSADTSTGSGSGDSASASGSVGAESAQATDEGQESIEATDSGDATNTEASTTTAEGSTTEDTSEDGGTEADIGTEEDGSASGDEATTGAEDTTTGEDDLVLLIERVWIVKKILDASGEQIGPWPSDASLHFAESGQLSVSTGCQLAASNYSYADGHLRLTDIVEPGDCPNADEAVLHHAVARVIATEEPVAVEIEPFDLRLWVESGQYGLELQVGP